MRNHGLRSPRREGQLALSANQPNHGERLFRRTILFASAEDFPKYLASPEEQKKLAGPGDVRSEGPGMQRTLDFPGGTQ